MLATFFTPLVLAGTCAAGLTAAPDTGAIGQCVTYAERPAAKVERHIVPTTDADGIVVDLAERALYWFDGGHLKARYPVAAGKPDWPTPTGDFWISGRRKDPTWHVPRSIQHEMAREGYDVETVVLPGPRNPLGRHFIQLSADNLGLHGTNAPWSVGRFATHGCMRMRATDVKRIFDEAPDHTPVRIVYQPLQIAVDDEGGVYLEVHRDVYGRYPNDLARVRARLEAAELADRVEWPRVAEALRKAAGQVVDVTRGRRLRPPSGRATTSE
ncbi:MAG: L,D-transpeptidase [Candidatus Binatia bacterium]